jgi:hypothetical protein
MSNIVAFNRHKLYRLDDVKTSVLAGCSVEEALEVESPMETFWEGTRRLQALFGIAFCLFVVGLVVGWVS